MTPYQRTKALLEKQGFRVWKTEMWNSFARKRQDLFGFADLVALHPALSGVLGVNTTTSPNLSAHKKKYELNKDLILWLQCGNRFSIHAWGKKGERGK